MKNTALVKARHKAGFTQKQVADHVGIAEVSYQRIEYGQQPSLRTAIRIADLLNIRDLRELWSGNFTAL